MIAAKRRGVVLILAVLLIGMVAGLLSIFAIHAARNHQRRQDDRLRMVVRTISRSAVGYARRYVLEESDGLPDRPVELDVSALLGPEMTGSAVLTFPTVENRTVCRVTAQAAWGGRQRESTTDLELPPSTTSTQPSPNS